MPSAATLQDTAWYRLVRCLVLLYVAILDRRIAKMLQDMDRLEYLGPAYMDLNARCYFLEDIRDAYRAWLEDPTNPLPRPYDPNVRARARIRTPHPGMRPHVQAARPAIRFRARCTTDKSHRPSRREAASTRAH